VRGALSPGEEIVAVGGHRAAAGQLVQRTSSSTENVLR
jgi:hypothetical protein